MNIMTIYGGIPKEELSRGKAMILIKDAMNYAGGVDYDIVSGDPGFTKMVIAKGLNRKR